MMRCLLTSTVLFLAAFWAGLCPAGAPVVGANGEEDAIRQAVVSPADDEPSPSDSLGVRLSLEEQQDTPLVFRDSANLVIVSPDGRWLITACGQHTIGLWNLEAARQARRTGSPDGVTATLVRGHESRVSAMTVSPDGRWLVAGGDDKTTRQHELFSLEPIQQRHWLPVLAVSLRSEDGK